MKKNYDFYPKDQISDLLIGWYKVNNIEQVACIGRFNGQLFVTNELNTVEALVMLQTFAKGDLMYE